MVSCGRGGQAWRSFNNIVSTMKLISFFLLLLTYSLSLAASDANQQSTNTAVTPEPLIAVADVKADLQQLYESLQLAHADLYANTDKQTYDAHYNRLMATVRQPMSRLQAAIMLQKFVALSKVAHARIDYVSDAFEAYRAKGGKALPIYVRIDDGRWTVTENFSGQPIPIGAEILALNSEPVDVWFKRMRAHISADTDAIAASLLEYQMPMYLWLLGLEAGTNTDEYEITFAVDNKRTHATVKARTRAELEQNTASKPSDDEATTESGLRSFRMLNETIGYLQPGPFYHAESPANLWDNQAFAALMDAAFELFLEQNASDLLIDLRDNPGGDNSFSDLMISWYADRPFRFADKFIVRSSPQAKASNAQRMKTQSSPNPVSAQLAEQYEKSPVGTNFDFPIPDSVPREDSRYTGRIWVLIDRHSYSNAVSVAAITQDYGFGKVIGESTTDFATTYGAMETFELARTGLTVGFPKALIVRPSGDRQPGPVVPDVELDLDALEGDADMVRLIQKLRLASEKDA